MPKMRLAWYAGTSAVLAAGVITSAFYQRANFYSAMVYLAQSNLCLMILVNLVFLVYGSFMYGLQRLCFGQLRPVEIEQLYEKAWFAVTETCLAMTVFREEVGAFFLVMFTALITGKVWGWIGEGRVEILEQQPPANPRLFHTRLTISLLTSVIYNFWLLHYSVNTVVQQARPNMMVMFLFEFAVLAIGSVHTALRYILSLVEQRVVKTQTQQRLEQRRSQIRTERNEILRRRESGEVPEGETEEPLPSEDDIDEMDIEVPGWESKGQWVLSLDLVADFLKLCIYAAFFFVLLMFYGLPIHIMRDLFMTTRSFVKRLGALLRYRQALRDMNKYPDATEEELSREDTCIICREEMQPWDPANPGQVERSRPKKLPCGHILHFGCLKSWLERQQVCPTCRSSVVVDPAAAPRNRDPMAFRIPGLNEQNQNQDQGVQPNGPAPGGQPAANGQGPGGQQPAGNGGNIRMFNLGPIRLGFAQGGVQEMQEMAQRMGVGEAANVQAAPQTPQVQQTPSTDLSSMDTIRAQLADIEQRIQQEMRNVQNAQLEMQMFNLLYQELNRLRQLQQLQAPTSTTTGQNAPAVLTPGSSAPAHPLPPQSTAGPIQQPLPQQPPTFPLPPGQMPLPPAQHMPSYPFPQRLNSPSISRYGGAAYTTAIPAGSPDLPEGVVIPPGWSLLPLQRYADGAPLPAGSAAPTAAAAPTAIQIQLQDILQPLAQQSPPPVPPPTSTHTNVGSEASSAPGINGSINSHDASEPSTQQGESSRTAPESQHRDPPAVAAPTPVMPNWGGSSQLFGGGGGNMPFGFQQTASNRSTPAQNDVSSEAHQASSAAGEGSTAGGAPDEGTNGNTSKGKAPAATVEDADDDE